MNMNPYLSGMILSVALGLPTGISVVRSLRELENGQEEEVEEDTWDSEWDLK